MGKYMRDQIAGNKTLHLSSLLALPFVAVLYRITDSLLHDRTLAVALAALSFIVISMTIQHIISRWLKTKSSDSWWRFLID